MWTHWHLSYCKNVYCTRVYPETCTKFQYLIVHLYMFTLVVPYNVLSYTCPRWHVSYCTGYFGHVSAEISIVRQVYTMIRVLLYNFWTSIHCDTCLTLQIVYYTRAYVDRCRTVQFVTVEGSMWTRFVPCIFWLYTGPRGHVSYSEYFCCIWFHVDTCCTGQLLL